MKFFSGLAQFFSCGFSVQVNNARMNASVAADWRADLEASRDLSDLEKQGFGFLLSWLESWPGVVALCRGKLLEVSF